jgi:leucyl aminopeptidase (aminopeptidase T)
VFRDANRPLRREAKGDSHSAHFLGMTVPSVREADRLARAVLTRRVHLKPNENVTIEVYPTALPWALGFVREARRLGARPLLHYEDEVSYWTAVEEGKADLIGTPGAHEWAALSKTDVYIYFWGPEDDPRLNQLPGATVGKLQSFNPTWYERADRAGARGVRMGIARVTPAAARQWGVPLEAWRKEMVNASLLDPKDFLPDARKLRRVLEGRRTLRIRHPNGTDLTLAVVGRKARVPLGMITPAWRRQRPFGVMASVPDGSVYVAVDESTAEGTFVSNRTTAPFGEPIRTGRWTFRRGRLVGQSYATGGRGVRAAYAQGKKGRDRPAMLEVGLDPSIHISPNMAENERGAISVAIGSNTGFGGRTAAQFNMILTVGGAELLLDDRPVVRDGRIL